MTYTCKSHPPPFFLNNEIYYLKIFGLLNQGLGCLIYKHGAKENTYILEVDLGEAWVHLHGLLSFLYLFPYSE